MRHSILKSLVFALSALTLAACSPGDELTGSYVYEQNPRATLSIGGGTMTAGGGPTSVSAAYKILSKDETPVSGGRSGQRRFRVELSMPDMNPGQFNMTLAQNILVIEEAALPFGGRWVKQ